MNSNEHSSPFRPRPSRQPGYRQLPPRSHVQEDTLKTEGFQIERKFFIFQLKQNPRGRFLRITEQGGKNFNSIVIPSTGLNEFKSLLAEMVKTSDEIPAKSSSGA